MFEIFKKKKEEENSSKENTESEETSEEEGESEEKSESENSSEDKSSSGNNNANLAVEIDRIKASVESFSEVRKSFSERFTQMSEQIGELRAMILDRDRNIQSIELKAIKAADLVAEVQPDKFMTELRKGEAKFEALKANLEGNEAVLDRVMEELREIRKKIEFFRGIEEIIKLAEETKKELIDIKKVEATINLETDKAQTFYSEIRKRYKEVEGFNDSLTELKVINSQNSRDIELMKNKIIALVEKDDLDKLVQKLQRSIDSMKELNKTSSLSKDVSQLKELIKGIS